MSISRTRKRLSTPRIGTQLTAQIFLAVTLLRVNNSVTTLNQVNYGLYEYLQHI